MEGKLIILGCGGSAGTPAIGNWWGACDPNEPRNRRTRPSVAIKTDHTLVIVDTGPDFREQINRENLGCPDAIIITHIHSDHTNGIDETRTLQRLHKRKFPVYALEETINDMMRRFDYMFEERESGFYPAVLDPITVKLGNEISINDLDIQTYPLEHGSIQSIGLRLGNVAYSTDLKRLEQSAFDSLKGVDTWIVDAAAYHTRENKVHPSIDEIIEMNDKIGARRVVLTHLPPTMDYKTLLNELPKGYEPAYDGMSIDFRI